MVTITKVTRPALAPNRVVTAMPPKRPASTGRPEQPKQMPLKKKTQPSADTPLTPLVRRLLARFDGI
jgi:hypothetical protein